MLLIITLSCKKKPKKVMLVVMLVMKEQGIDSKINYIQTKANLRKVLRCTQHLTTFQITIHHFYRLV